MIEQIPRSGKHVSKLVIKLDEQVVRVGPQSSLNVVLVDLRMSEVCRKAPAMIENLQYIARPHERPFN